MWHQCWLLVSRGTQTAVSCVKNLHFAPPEDRLALLSLSVFTRCVFHADIPAHRNIAQSLLKCAPWFNHTPESWTTSGLLYLMPARPGCLQYEPFCLDTHYPPAPKTVESIPSQGVIMAQLLFVGLSMPRLWGRLQKATRTHSVCRSNAIHL